MLSWCFKLDLGRFVPEQDVRNLTPLAAKQFIIDFKKKWGQVPVNFLWIITDEMLSFVTLGMNTDRKYLWSCVNLSAVHMWSCPVCSLFMERNILLLTHVYDARKCLLQVDCMLSCCPHECISSRRISQFDLVCSQYFPTFCFRHLWRTSAVCILFWCVILLTPPKNVNISSFLLTVFSLHQVSQRHKAEVKQSQV